MAATITPFDDAEPSRSPHSIKYVLSNNSDPTVTARRTLAQMNVDMRRGPLLAYLNAQAGMGDSGSSWIALDRRAEFTMVLQPFGQTLLTSVQAYFTYNGDDPVLEVVVTGIGSVILELRFHPTQVR